MLAADAQIVDLDSRAIKAKEDSMASQVLWVRKLRFKKTFLLKNSVVAKFFYRILC